MPRAVMAEPLAVAVTTAELAVTDETVGLVTDRAVEEPLPPLSAGESSSPQPTASSPKVSKKNNLDKYFIITI
jgi:hypothetical protein